MSCPLTLRTLYSMPLLVPLPAAAGSLFPSRPSYHPFPSVPVNLHVFTIPLPSLVPRPCSGAARARLTLKGIGRALARAFPLLPIHPPTPIPMFPLRSLSFACIITDNAAVPVFPSSFNRAAVPHTFIR